MLLSWGTVRLLLLVYLLWTDLIRATRHSLAPHTAIKLAMHAGCVLIAHVLLLPRRYEGLTAVELLSCEV